MLTYLIIFHLNGYLTAVFDIVCVIDLLASRNSAETECVINAIQLISTNVSLASIVGKCGLPLYLYMTMYSI